jgi:tetratricopeptide (TPR) repeat protein
VAFKVIKLGMDTKQVVARFEAEGQALAMMDHPNIAKVFDAGATTTGRPYFVMELVRGIKITEYCDQNNLPTEARLKLFTQVCHAIQHAHQKGIIHRDIKPSNILVTVNDGMPVPKVIDFGIAKAIEQRLTDKTVFTAFEQFIGTPAYMSPEQAEMTSLDIDTRADIYSLGVLLYELLSGNTPFDAEKLVASGVAEIRRIIREQEPPKPSTRLNTLNDADLGTVASRRQTDPPKLMHLIRGDLDWIVMKCLEKDRTRRYETANGLAVDIQRHLSNEPVVARPPSNLYRFQKLVRRNKLTFAATSAVIAALVLGLGLSTWMFFKEKQARQRAVAAEQKARSEATKSQQFAQFLQDMLNKLGLNLMDDKFVDQGKLAEAELMLKEQLAKRRELLGNEHPDVASSLNTLTLVLQRQGKLAEAETAVREALAIWRKRFGSEHISVTFSLGCLGGILQQQGKLPEAEAVVREDLAIRRKQLGNEHPGLRYTFHALTAFLCEQGKFGEAEAAVREELALSRKLGNADPQVAHSICHLGDVLSLERKYAEAETLLREELERERKLFGDVHREVDGALGSLARVLQQEGKLAEAETARREELALERKLSGDEHPFVANSLIALARVLQDQGKLPEAETTYGEALVMRRKFLSADDPTLAYALAGLTSTLLATQKFTEAEPLARECLTIREKKLPDDWRTFNARSVLGGSLLGQKKYAEAEPLLLSGYEGMKQREDKIPASGKPRVKEALDRLVQLYEATGQSEKAAEWNRKLAEFDQAEAEKKTAAPKPSP